MITFIGDNFKSFSQESYNKFLKDINIYELPCSCDIKGHFIKYGHYNRNIKIAGKSITLRIQRLLCKSCGKTHALLPKDLVPYSQISVHDHIFIIEAYLSLNSYEDIMINNEFINENTISYIINKFRCVWHQALLSLDLSVKSKLDLVVSRCLIHFKRQFMQIKSTINILFSRTNIT